MTGKLAHILDTDELAKIAELRAKAIGPGLAFFLKRAGFSEAQWERGGDFSMLLSVLREVGVELHAVDGGATLPFQSRDNPANRRERSAGGLFDHVLDPKPPRLDPGQGEVVG